MHLGAGHIVNGRVFFGVFNNGREYHVDISQCLCLGKCMYVARVLHMFCPSDIFSAGTRSRTPPIAQMIYCSRHCRGDTVLIRAASRPACNVITEGSNRRNRAPPNQIADARSSWIAHHRGSSQPEAAIGFVANAQANQVAAPSKLPLCPL